MAGVAKSVDPFGPSVDTASDALQRARARGTTSVGGAAAAARGSATAQAGTMAKRHPLVARSGAAAPAKPDGFFSGAEATMQELNKNLGGDDDAQGAHKQGYEAYSMQYIGGTLPCGHGVGQPLFERQDIFSNTVTGAEKRAYTRGILDQARKIVRERSAGGTHTEQQYLHNVAEGDAEAFDAKWAEDAFLLGLTAGREPLAVTKQEGLYEGGVQQVMIRERQKAQLDRGMLRSAMGASQALDFSAVPMSFGKNFDSSAIKEAMGMEPPPKRTEQSVAISVDRVNRMRMKSRNHSYN